jgi:large subunit ribosomal protein L24
MSLKLKKGDLVQIIAGKDKGKKGKLLNILFDKNRALVDGLNLVKKHKRKTSQEQKSGIVEIPGSIHISNLQLFCSNCKKGVRYSVKVTEDKNKQRICKICGAQL